MTSSRGTDAVVAVSTTPAATTSPTAVSAATGADSRCSSTRASLYAAVVRGWPSPRHIRTRRVKNPMPSYFSLLSMSHLPSAASRHQFLKVHAAPFFHSVRAPTSALRLFKDGLG